MPNEHKACTLTLELFETYIRLKDMRIRLWSPKMEAGATFDMSAFGPCPVVHSICLSSDGTKLLVGVKGCEVRALTDVGTTYA